MRFKSNIAILLFIFRFDNSKKEVLLQKRISSYANNMWDASCSGHVEEGESFSSAAIREANEELGITIDKKNLKFKKIYQNYKKAYVNVLFEIEKYKGKIEIKEKDKCKELRWFDINKLPKGTISYVNEAVMNEDIIYDDLDIKLNNQ